MLTKVTFCFVLALIMSSFGVDASKENEGYPYGLISTCEGSTKKAVIRNRTLAKLQFAIEGSDFQRSYHDYFSATKAILESPDIDFARKTMIYLPGYLQNGRSILERPVGYLYKNMGYNVLSIDSFQFTAYDYPQASRIIRPLGRKIAIILAQLTKHGLDPKKLELLGLSLGAHTASFMAKHFRQLTGYNVSRITGLDPSGPCFRNLPLTERLDKSDADFVDMVATNIDALGMATPLGHVNFYVNGGENQLADLELFLCTSMCSHVKSLQYWISALLNPKKFIAIRCDSIQQARYHQCYDRTPIETNFLGLETNKDKQGIYYLATDNRYPYYLGKNGISKKFEMWSSHTINYNRENVFTI